MELFGSSSYGLTLPFLYRNIDQSAKLPFYAGIAISAREILKDIEAIRQMLIWRHADKGKNPNHDKEYVTVKWISHFRVPDLEIPFREIPEEKRNTADQITGGIVYSNDQAVEV